MQQAKTDDVRLILFDLGGVLVELDGPPLKPEWLQTSISVEENWKRWVESPLVEALEKGEISSQYFAEGLIAELALQVSAGELIEQVVRWPLGLFPRAECYLKELRQHYPLACYSNTSELHWPRLMGEMGLEKLLDHAFASFLMGCYKPDRSGFDYVIEKLSLEPQQIVFLDDNIANVDTAEELGLIARHVRGLQGVHAALRELGLKTPALD